MLVLLNHYISAQMSTIACKGCFKEFAKWADLLGHQKQAKRCQWVHEEHLAQNPAPCQNITDFEDLEEDPPIKGSDWFTAVDDFEMEGLPAGPSTDADTAHHSGTASGNPQGETGARNRPQSCAQVANTLEDNLVIIQKCPGTGQIYGENQGTYHEYKDLGGTEDCPWHPFKSELEWELAKWAKNTQQAESALTKLLTIPGVSELLLFSYPWCTKIYFF
jgi:hypothetical protein